MEGKGFYDHHSEAQGDAIRRQAGRLRNAVRHVDLSGAELRILDYGCGPGRDSAAALRVVLDELRRRDAGIPVVAVHNDLIGNDWNGLFANISGPQGYLHGERHIRVEASIGSFFDAVAIQGSVDLGLSFAASHWLSDRVRVHSPGSLFFSDLPQPARDEVAAMAARNWIDFLRRRAAETCSGGWLVVDGLSSIPDSSDPGGRCPAGRGLYRAFWEVAEELAEMGRIKSALLDAFVFPVYFRLPEEVRAPLEHDADLKGAFEIVELANERLPMTIEQALAATGDVASYAESYAGFARAFAESTLRDGLFIGSTPDAQAAQTLSDDFFDRLRDLFAAEPNEHSFDHLVVTTVLRRR